MSKILLASILLLSAHSRLYGQSSPDSDFPPSDSQILVTQRMGLGLGRALARRQQQAAPDSPDTVRLLLRAGMTGDAFALARRVVETRPERLVEVLNVIEPAGWFNEGDAPDIIAAARKQLPSLPREDAARIARMLIDAKFNSQPGSEDRRVSELERFVEKYDGTQEAQQTKVTVIALRNRDISRRVQELETFARQNPRTLEAARALFSGAWDLSVNAIAQAPRGSDPTERFMKVFQIATELESGSYQPCEWVEKAPKLVVEFSAPEAKYSPDNRDRMIEMYTQFVARHFALHEADATEWDSGYVVAHKIADLFDQRDERVAGVERTLTRLERDVPDADAVRYLRALFYRREMNYASSADERATLRRKAGATLLALARDGRGSSRRKALATLASLHFDEKDYRTAANYFREFLDAYPESDWAWVAALRIAQTQEALNELDASVGSYQAAAARYESNPQARVLGHVYAARLLEARGAFDEAAGEYRTALAGWDTNYETRFSSYWPRLPPTTERPFAEDRGVVDREDLPLRIAELRRTSSLPGGALLERARGLLARQQWIEAQAVLRDAMTAYPQSAAIEEAREMLHRAQLSAILDLADPDHATVDDTKTLDNLATLAREPYTFDVSAAKIASATILKRRGANAEAQALMTAALQELHARQHRSLRQPQTPLEKDIAAIQDLVFRPKGDGIFRGTTWEGDPFGGGSAAFVVVGSDIRVTLAGESVQRVTSNHVPTGGRSSVLLMNDDQQSVFARIITKLGGTGRRDAVAVMQPPNQPDARAEEIVTFWNEFFRMRPGHWGGWMFSTNPVITGIEFEDVARTKAYAEVTIGYEGATVALEKNGGVWKALGIGGRWIQ